MALFQDGEHTGITGRSYVEEAAKPLIQDRHFSGVSAGLNIKAS